MRKSRLRSRLILGFAVITVPLLFLLLFNNWYSMNVVRNQVAASNQNLVKMYMDQVDRGLQETEKYLTKTALLDIDINSLSTYPEKSDEAYYAKIKAFNTLNSDITYYPEADAFFAYGAGPKELLFVGQTYLDYNKKEFLKDRLETILGDPDERKALIRNWMVFNLNGEYSLLRIMDTGKDSFVGAWIQLNRMLKPFYLVDIGKEGQVLFASPSGTILAQNGDLHFTETIMPSMLQKTLQDTGKPYNTLKYGNDSDYMVVSRPSQSAALYLAVLLPVNSLLEKLPAFQRLIYATPLIVIILLLIYLLYLQRSIAVPVHKLMKGMQKIRSGYLSARLEPSSLTEFNAINDTFNSMVEEIENLKIDIYEEQLNTQKAELKHLQAQIHPHFFMNSLNLIYNLAQVKNIELVQKMAVYLVRHFRFTISTNLTSVTLKDELDHIGNYLNIQKLRFPESFDFRIQIEPGVEMFAIPPLTVQPFVENAMEHGFTYKPDGPFMIEVRVKLQQTPDAAGDYVVVTVDDNGKGFEPDKLAMLQSEAYFNNPFDEHVGIWNVWRRCRLYYRSQVQLTFANHPHGGAVAILQIPVQEDNHGGGPSDVQGADRR